MEQNQTIQYKIAFVSSEDPGYLATELLTPTSNSKGWQTQRYCIYPQILILEISNPSKINKFQLLSHQSKISTKVEVHLSYQDEQRMPYNIQDLDFQKIGYFSLSSNEKNNFHARELKTVYLDAPAKFIKFQFHQPYTNTINLFNQIGVIGIQFFGQFLQNFGKEQNMNKEITMDLQQKINYDEKTLTLLETLEQQKKIAIENENFKEAKVLVEKIKNLKNIAEQLKILEQRKQIAIQNDDFDAAIIIKDEVKNLKKHAQIEEMYFSQIDDNNQIQKSSRHQMNHQEDYNPYENQNQSYNPYTPQKNLYKDQKIQESILKNKSIITNHNEKVIPTLAQNNQKQDQMQSQIYEDQDLEQEQQEQPKLDKKALEKVNIFSEYFSNNFLMFCFSSNWKHKKNQCQKLIDFLQEIQKGNIDLPNNILHVPNLPKAFFAIWQLNNEFLETQIPKLNQNSFNLLEQLLQIKQQYNDQIILNQGEWNKIQIDTLIHIMNYSKDYKIEGHIQRLVEILKQIVLLKIGRMDKIIQQFTKQEGLPKKYQSTNHMIGRFEVLIRLTDELKTMIELQQWQELLKFSIDHYENKQKEIRDLAHDLILIIFQVIGENETMKFLDQCQLRPLHKNTLEREFQNILESQQPQYKSQVFNKDEYINEQDDQIQQNNQDQQEQYDENQNSESEVDQDTCQFCRRNDENFIYEDRFNMHLWKECPMLLTCQYCNQVIEIKEYYIHLQQDCQENEKFEQCPKCTFPIDKNLLNDHLKNEECIIIDENMLKCPLCNIIIQNVQNENKSWRNHLIDEGCIKNPRTNQIYQQKLIKSKVQVLYFKIFLKIIHQIQFYQNKMFNKFNHLFYLNKVQVYQFQNNQFFKNFFYVLILDGNFLKDNFQLHF